MAAATDTNIRVGRVKGQVSIYSTFPKSTSDLCRTSDKQFRLLACGLPKTSIFDVSHDKKRVDGEGVFVPEFL